MTLIRDVSDLIEITLNKWLIRAHQPIDASEAHDGTGPAICPRCGVGWPCRDMVQAFAWKDDLDARRRE